MTNCYEINYKKVLPHIAFQFTISFGGLLLRKSCRTQPRAFHRAADCVTSSCGASVGLPLNKPPFSGFVGELSGILAALVPTVGPLIGKCG